MTRSRIFNIVGDSNRITIWDYADDRDHVHMDLAVLLANGRWMAVSTLKVSRIDAARVLRRARAQQADICWKYFGTAGIFDNRVREWPRKGVTA